MRRVLLNAAGLTALYLLFLTSVDPGDVLFGVALSLVLAVVLRPRHRIPRRPGGLSALAGAAGLVVGTAADMVRGSWRVARFCLGAPAQPGLVEIPRGERSDGAVALWGVLTGEAPDEYPVEVDDERGILVVHVLDAGEPDAVRERHAANYERWQKKVVP